MYDIGLPELIVILIILLILCLFLGLYGRKMAMMIRFRLIVNSYMKLFNSKKDSRLSAFLKCNIRWLSTNELEDVAERIRTRTGEDPLSTTEDGSIRDVLKQNNIDLQLFLDHVIERHYNPHTNWGLDKIITEVKAAQPSFIDETVNYKVYTPGWIMFATYLGGPMAGCYLVSKNFKIFRNEKSAKKILVVGVISSVIIFTGLCFVPKHIMDAIPDFLIPLIYMFVIGDYVKKTQSKNIKVHIAQGGQKYSGWKVTGIGILFLILTLLYIVPVYSIVHMFILTGY
jgi:hypothetical protein